jgi:hypothetical protein
MMIMKRMTKKKPTIFIFYNGKRKQKKMQKKMQL